MRVLVVEDDPDLSRQLITALTDAGYAVDSATDGEEGYHLGDTEPYDVVVLDVGLPKMDGISVLAQLIDDEAGESTAAVMRALWTVLETYGVPGALYTDRAAWAVYTPTSGTAPDRRRLTQVGRALARLGIEHIVGFSPQARGRSERANGTLQGRLVNELRVAGIDTVDAANAYLRTRFQPDYDATFGRAPADPASAFVPVGPYDLDQILCHEDERVVARDNTVTLDGVCLQIDKQRGRRSCAALRVLVRRHLSGQHSLWWGPRCLGRYTADGRPQRPPARDAGVAAPQTIARPRPTAAPPVQGRRSEHRPRRALVQA